MKKTVRKQRIIQTAMNNSLVTVATFVNSIEAALAQHELEAEGIHAYVTDEATVNMAWHLTTAVGWIKLQVLPSDVERAKAILSAREQEFQDTEEEEDIKPERLSWADEMVEKAFRNAILGLIFFPLQLYSLWLLIRLFVSQRMWKRINPKRRWKAFAAILIDIPVMIIVWIFVSIFAH